MIVDPVQKFERLMNLVAFLLASGEPVPFSSIRKQVVGYNDYAREDAVEKRFDRDKKELREIGIPVEYTPADEQGRDGYFIPLDQYFHHELDLAPDEAALLVMLANAARAGNDAIHANLRSALLKMAIDSPVQDELAEAIGKRHVHAFARGRRDRAQLDNLDKLVAAIAARKGARFKYRPLNSKRAVERRVHPYGLGYREGEWYLVGEDQEREDLRQFKLSRIQGAVVVKRGKKPEFAEPADFDIEEHMERPPWAYQDGKAEWAEIMFHADVAWIVEENLERGQEFKTRKDGSGVLRLQVHRSDDAHKRLLTFLAGYSGQCAVLKPAWLRRQAIADLKELRARYG